MRQEDFHRLGAGFDAPPSRGCRTDAPDPVESRTSRYLRRQRGVTLIELLVVVGIIGIMAATAAAVYETYRKRAYEATAITYMRSWIPAQEEYLQRFGHYADADEQLAQAGIGILFVPTNVPYNFAIDSGNTEDERWWGSATPRTSGLRYFAIDETGVVRDSTAGPPGP